MDILIAYDIADTESTGAARLRRIHDACTRFGQRVQFSVFECRLSQARLARLVGEIEDIIDSERDSVLIYRFSGELKAATIRLGRDQSHPLGEPWIV